MRCANPQRWRSAGSSSPSTCPMRRSRSERIGGAGATCDHVDEGLGVSRNTANSAVLEEGRRVLIDDPRRFDGVSVVGVDEHAWRHTRRGDKYVTVIIDLTAVRAGSGPARLLDMVEGRSKQAFKTWLAARDESW